MKSIRNISILAVILITVISFTVKSQTNVSGGIYTNTTWTKASSPYVVTDTVVVFPGVTLTIQPGVVVKFDNNIRLEIRQALIIAQGISNDSITFTSNSSSPFPGIYPGIFLNAGSQNSLFNYCKFTYASIGVNATVSGSLNVSNSFFTRNLTGLQFINSPGSALINSTTFNNNSSGLILENISNSTVSYCNFSNNYTSGFILGNNLNATTNNCNFSNNGKGISMNIHNSVVNQCHFTNNTSGVEGGTGEATNDVIYPNIVKNCIFDFNQQGFANIDEILIDHCRIIQNQTGYSGSISRIKNCIVDSNAIVGLSTYNDSVVNCTIKYNNIGLQSTSYAAIIDNDIEYNPGANINCSTFNAIITGNSIRFSSLGIGNITGSFLLSTNIIENNGVGIILNSSAGTISCNRICNNTTYDLKYGASSNLNASHNYWCADSTTTEALIYDGYDNISYGLVNFMPVDSICVPGFPNAINEFVQENPIHIFPNPASDYLTVELPANSAGTEIKIFNILGELEYSSIMTEQKSNIDVSTLANGLYFIQVTTSNNMSRQKILKQ